MGTHGLNGVSVHVKESSGNFYFQFLNRVYLRKFHYQNHKYKVYSDLIRYNKYKIKHSKASVEFDLVRFNACEFSSYVN